MAAADRLLPVLRELPGRAARGRRLAVGASASPRAAWPLGAPCTQATAPHPGTARLRHPGWPSWGGEPVLSHFPSHGSHMGPIHLPQRHLQLPPHDLMLGGVHRLRRGGLSSHLTPPPGAASRWRPASAAHRRGTPDRPGHEVGHHPQEVRSPQPASFYTPFAPQSRPQHPLLPWVQVSPGAHGAQDLRQLRNVRPQQLG